MKRKLKTVGLSALLVAVVFAVANSAASGSVGFGVAVIFSYFLAVLFLGGIFVLSVKEYRFLMKHFATPKQPPKLPADEKEVENDE